MKSESVYSIRRLQGRAVLGGAVTVTLLLAGAARAQAPSGVCAMGVEAGDVDGDGRSDLVCRDGRMSLSNGTAQGGTPGFREEYGFQPDSGACTGVVLKGDFTGDGRTDLLCYEEGGVRVAAPVSGGAASMHEKDWLAGPDPCDEEGFSGAATMVCETAAGVTVQSPPGTVVSVEPAASPLPLPSGARANDGAGGPATATAHVTVSSCEGAVLVVDVTALGLTAASNAGVYLLVAPVTNGAPGAPLHVAVSPEKTVQVGGRWFASVPLGARCASEMLVRPVLYLLGRPPSARSAPAANTGSCAGQRVSAYGQKVCQALAGKAGWHVSDDNVIPERGKDEPNPYPYTDPPGFADLSHEGGFIQYPEASTWGTPKFGTDAVLPREMRDMIARTIHHVNVAVVDWPTDGSAPVLAHLKDGVHVLRQRTAARKALDPSFPNPQVDIHVGSRPAGLTAAGVQAILSEPGPAVVDLNVVMDDSESYTTSWGRNDAHLVTRDGVEVLTASGGYDPYEWGSRVGLRILGTEAAWTDRFAGELFRSRCGQGPTTSLQNAAACDAPGSELNLPLPVGGTTTVFSVVRTAFPAGPAMWMPASPALLLPGCAPGEPCEAPGGEPVDEFPPVYQYPPDAPAEAPVEVPGHSLEEQFWKPTQPGTAGGAVPGATGMVLDTSDEALVALIDAAESTVYLSQSKLQGYDYMPNHLAVHQFSEDVMRALGEAMLRDVDVYVTLSTGGGGANLFPFPATLPPVPYPQVMARLMAEQMTSYEYAGGARLPLEKLCEHLHVAPFSRQGTAIQETNDACFLMVDEAIFYVGSQCLYPGKMRRDQCSGGPDHGSTGSYPTCTTSVIPGGANVEHGLIVDDAGVAAEVVQRYWSPQWQSSTKSFGAYIQASGPAEIDIATCGTAGVMPLAVDPQGNLDSTGCVEYDLNGSSLPPGITLELGAHVPLLGVTGEAPNFADPDEPHRAITHLSFPARYLRSATVTFDRRMEPPDPVYSYSYAGDYRLYGSRDEAQLAILQHAVQTGELASEVMTGNTGLAIVTQGPPSSMAEFLAGGSRRGLYYMQPWNNVFATGLRVCEWCLSGVKIPLAKVVGYKNMGFDDTMPDMDLGTPGNQIKNAKGYVGVGLHCQGYGANCCRYPTDAQGCCSSPLLCTTHRPYEPEITNSLGHLAEQESIPPPGGGAEPKELFTIFRTGAVPSMIPVGAQRQDDPSSPEACVDFEVEMGLMRAQSSIGFLVQNLGGCAQSCHQLYRIRVHEVGAAPTVWSSLGDVDVQAGNTGTVKKTLVADMTIDRASLCLVRKAEANGEWENPKVLVGHAYITPHCGSNAAPSNCLNGQKDGGESGVDCGGSTCARCDTGASCNVDADCASGHCNGAAHACLAPTCNDSRKNGDETGADCGGSCPSSCISSCNNSVKDAGEMGIDCGGPHCKPCETGAACTDGTGCASGPCVAGVCVAATAANGVWPNEESQASSDAWLSEHHAQIQVLRPKVLVLQFDNEMSPAAADQRLRDLQQTIAAASRYHPNPSAPFGVPALQPRILKTVDLTDGSNPPYPGYPYKNSTKYPREIPKQEGWAFDYGALFGQQFAQHYGVKAPDGHDMSLCELIDSGTIHEVWMLFNGAEPEHGLFAPAEVLEMKRGYSTSRTQLAWWEPCAGNGCFDAEDIELLPTECKLRSIRILSHNTSRGPETFVHNIGHGFEQLSVEKVIPYFTEYFREFAGQDLDERYGVSFKSWYEVCGEVDSCLEYSSSSGEVTYSNHGHSPPHNGTLSSYVPACGDIHYPPNARHEYDYDNPMVWSSTCDHFRRFDAPGGGADAIDQLGGATWGSELSWISYWFNHFPGYGNLSKDDEGAPMLSWWPFLYY